MRARTLLTQVLAVNALLVLVAVMSVLLVTGGDDHALSRETVLLLALSLFSVILLNSLLLRRRLAPLDALVTFMSAATASPSAAPTRPPTSPLAAREVRELSAGFERVLQRLRDERRRAADAVLQAQEQERARLARDLHDEVNQALTGILLRLEATIGDAPEGLRDELRETKALANQAMEELLGLAHHLRPTSLDDHGLIATLSSQAADFAERTGIPARFAPPPALPDLSGDEQLVIYRITQESLSNIAQHAAASEVLVELTAERRPTLRIRDDGGGFAVRRGEDGSIGGRTGGLGLSGMRERALQVGAELSVRSLPGDGTVIELRLEPRA